MAKKVEIKKVEPNKEPKYSTFVIHTAKYKTLLTKSFTERKKWVPANDKLIKALIPGNVGKINVKKGDEQKLGDTLLILEAMKMYNQILAPMDGIIKSVLVKEGAIVPKLTVLIEME
jgi:biotin carboxyl carrier protein